MKKTIYLMTNHVLNIFPGHFRAKSIIIAFLVSSLGLVLSNCSGDGNQSTEDSGGDSQRPNIVILFADDMGYGDLSSYGHPTIKTPNIDNFGKQGIRFTSFVTGSWCVPSRTQLLTGRYMPRVEFGGATGANGDGGIPDSELTLAEGLKEAGYNTGMVGKWHLGHAQDKFLPVNHGFDSWFGIPYSNDYRKPWVQTEVPLGLYQGTEMVEHPVNQNTLTTRYTEKSINFINDHAGQEKPFFLYLAYQMPHLPIHTTEEFRGKSRAGLYGDVIQTIDWSIGQVLETLKKQGIAENTVVFFASDNGPWLNLPDRMLQEGNKPWHAGSPGLLRGSKGTTYEGGARVPAMIMWPGEIPAGRVSDQLVASPDIFRTLLEIGGGTPPDHKIDGHNLLPFFKGETDVSARKEYAYFRGGNLQAMRVGDWKLRLQTGDPQLFNLQVDPGERHNRADEEPEKVEEIRQKMEDLAEEVGMGIPEGNSNL